MDRHLEWKVGLFFAGAFLAFLGIALDWSWLVGLATLVLLSGVALRFVPGGGRADQGDEGDREPSDDSGSDQPTP